MPDKVYKPTQYQLSQLTQSNGQQKRPTGNNKGLSQAYQIRDIAANALLDLKLGDDATLEDKVSRASALRSLTYVWQEASERIRIIKGKPMPGSLRPVAKPKKVRTISTKPLETLPADTSSTVQDKACLTDPLDKSDPSPPILPGSPLV